MRLWQHGAWCLALMLLLLTLAGPGASLAFGQEEAHQQFLFAYKLLQRGEDSQAIRAFDEFLQKYPQDEKRDDALYYRALLSQRGGDNQRAATLLRDVTNPKHVPLYAVHLLRGQVHTTLGQFDHALAALEQVDTKELPDDKLRASVHQLRAGAYRSVGNLDAAVQSLRLAAQLDSPLKGQALLDLGRVYAQRGDADEAIRTLQSALDLNDRGVAAEAARIAADQSYALKKYDDAVKYYAIVVTGHQTSSHFSPAVVGMLWSMLSAGQHEALLKTYEQHRGQLDDADAVTAGYLAGTALQEMGDHQRAIATFAQIMPNARQSRHHEQLLYKLALSQFETQQYDAMSRTLGQLFEAYPQSKLNVDGQFLLAATEARRGNLPNGIARLSAIIDFEPRHPYHDQALLQRAQLYEQSRQYEAAIEDYVRYLALPGKINEQGLFVDHDPVLRVSDLHFRLGRYDAVIKTLERLLDSHPKPDVAAEAHYRLAHVHIKQQHQAQAVAALTKVIDDHPQHALVGQAHYYRGLLNVSMGHTDAGLADLIAASNASLPQELLINALRLTAVSQRELDDPAPAVETLMRLRQIKGLTADEMLWLGKHFHDTGELTTAMAYLEPIVNAATVPTPIRAEALYLLGQCHRRSGALDKATAAFERILSEHPPSEPKARLALAQTLRDAGRIDDALAQYGRLASSRVSEVAAQSLYDSAEIYRSRVADLRRADNDAAAAEANQKAYDQFKRLVVLYAQADLSPMPELSMIQLAEISTEQGDAAAAQASLNELVEKFPESVYASYGRALLAKAGGARSEATFLINKLREQMDGLDPRLAQRVTKLHNELEVEP